MEVGAPPALSTSWHTITETFGVPRLCLTFRWQTMLWHRGNGVGVYGLEWFTVTLRVGRRQWLLRDRAREVGP